MQCPDCAADVPADSQACHACDAVLFYETSAWVASQDRYDELAARYAERAIDQQGFQSAHASLAQQDAFGRYWLPSQKRDEPYLWDGQAWKLQPVALASPEGTRASYAASAHSPTPRQTVSPQNNAKQSDETSRTPSDAATPKERHRLRGCCLGTCILLLLLCAAGVFVSPLPQRWGLRTSPAEHTFEPEPDRIASMALAAELDEAGVDTTGLYLYVLPYVERERGAVLYAVLDGTMEFRFPSRDPSAVLDYMALLAESETVQSASVSRIAVDYRDRSGAQIAVLTAPVDAVLAFSRGEMSQEDFMEALEGKIDVTGLSLGGQP